ncbi:MAG: EAL domain-containing protein [Selenomonadaceae bacterium]|nr:EAL domain-containing protein [Selenomonadaceae bacterium]
MEMVMKKPIRNQDVGDVLKELGKRYDMVRIVNPEECHTFRMNEDGHMVYGPDCYSVWHSTNRCRDCTSLRALKTGVELHKTEIKDGDLYEVTSRPVEILRDDELIYPCVIEMIRIRRGKGMKQDHHHAVLHEEYKPERFMELLQRAMQDFPYGMVWFDKEGHCLYANSEAFRLFRIADDLEKLSHILREWIQQDMLAGCQAASWIQSYETGVETKAISISRYPLHDSSGGVVGNYFLLRDCTQAQKNIDLEHFGTLHDSLTGLYNRYGFYRQARHCLESYPEEAYCLVGSNFCDFKLINNFYGLTKGNELLAQIGTMLRRHYEGDDEVAYGRIQDDRFALLIPVRRFHPEELLHDTEEIMQRIQPGNLMLQVTVGICRVEDAQTPISILCDRAFLAASSLEKMESSGFVWYQEDMLADKLHDQTILARFTEAMQNQEMQIFLQSQVDAQSGRVVGAEALSRWCRPDGSIISPALFVPVLEHHGKIWQLDYWVWEQSCSLLRKWQGTPLERCTISVNISVKDMYYLDLYEVFTHLVQQYDINPASLELEITETVFMDKPREAMALIRRLQAYGFRIAIDDFGSGYSSLRLLKDIQADILKIDMEFLQRTAHHRRSRIILQAIVSLAQALSMPTIVEGVETKEQADYLRSIGSTIFQGFYFSEPIPIAEFENRMQQEWK